MALTTMYCPRCDRSYTEDTYNETLEKVKKHVELQHPNHDPDWTED